MTALVIDASVAVKWFVPEEGTDLANELLKSQRDLVAPDFLWIEVAQVLWKVARRGGAEPEEVARMIASRPAFPVEARESSPLIADAVTLAIETDRTVYDCLYLALAIRERTILVTADERFVTALQSRSVGKRVTLLAPGL